MRVKVKQEILQLIAQYDGKWYWYQIDRYLSINNPETPGPYLDEIKALKQEGLIDERKFYGSQFRLYCITDAGRARLQ
jgi:hypothetical protein